MPQEDIIELQIGAAGSLVSGDIFVDFSTNTIIGGGLNVLVEGVSVSLGALTLTAGAGNTYTIAGASVAVGPTPAASVVLSLGSANPTTLSATSTVLGLATTQTEAVISAAVPCFASGTLIRTERGDIAVEKLKVGERVVTSSGVSRPIRWLGHRTIACRNHPRPHEAMPVRIAAHAFGDERPARDLFVSPGHSICVDLSGEALIPASALINGSTVQQVEVEEVTYWHVELDGHDILLANGLPAESYLEMRNRSFFADAAIVAIDAAPDADARRRTHADFCRPYHDHGPLVEGVRAQMRARAYALGWTLSNDTDLWLEVDGRRLRPVVRGKTARFHVPAEATDLWLVSPTARPSDAVDSLDVRALGLQVASFRIDDGFAAPRAVAIDDPLLCIGFYGVEDGAFRWTAGRARLPAALWQGCEDGFYLRVELAGPAIARWQRPLEARPALALVS